MGFWDDFEKRAADTKIIGRIYAQGALKDPGTMGLYNSLVVSSKRYADTVQALESTAKNVYQFGRGSTDAVQAADHARRQAHESLIGSIQAIFRRAIGTHKINIEPLRSALTDRNAAGEMGLAIAKKFRPMKKAAALLIGRILSAK